MLCGLGVPSLRSLWGAVRNRQLYILRMYCKGWISFNFSIFFIIYTTYSKKKKLHDLPQKLKNSIFFYNSHNLQQKKKNYTHLQHKKKLHDYTVFLYTTYIFHTDTTRHNPYPCAPCVGKGTKHAQQGHKGEGRGYVMRSPKGGLSAGVWRQEVVMCPRRGKDPASGHPRAHQPPLGRGTSLPAWDGCLDAPGQRRRHLPSSVWTPHREVKQGKSVGTTDQGNGKGRSGERPMDTTAYGGKGSKGRAANGDRPAGAASCRREQYTMASCQPPPPPGCA